MYNVGMSEHRNQHPPVEIKIRKATRKDRRELRDQGFRPGKVLMTGPRIIGINEEGQHITDGEAIDYRRKTDKIRAKQRDIIDRVKASRANRPTVRDRLRDTGDQIRTSKVPLRVAKVAGAVVAVSALSLGAIKASETHDYSQETKIELESNIQPAATRIANRMLRLIRSNRDNYDFQQMPAYQHPEHTTIYYSNSSDAPGDPSDHVEVTLGRTNGRPDPSEVISIDISRSYFDGEEYVSGESVEIYGPSEEFDGHHAWGAQRVANFDEEMQDIMDRSGSAVNTTDLLPYDFGKGSDMTRGEAGRSIAHEAEDLLDRIVEDIAPAA